MSLLDGLSSLVQIEVAWGDMDAWQHVNNALYFRYIETARLRFLADVGWDLSASATLLPVLSSVSARFLKPLTWPTTLTVGTRPTELREARFTLEHHLVARAIDGERLTTIGTSVVVPFDARSQRAARVPELVRERVRALLA